MKSFSRVLILAGPTASGKSALAVQLARLCNGTVINADSMQIYREIPVISAQPSAHDRQEIPHLLYGFQPVTESYSAVDWSRAACRAIHATHQAGRMPILVGGSGLYFRALVTGFSPMPEVPHAVRKHVTDLYDMLGANGFHNALQEIDPEIAARLHPTDRQRCIRAREVFEASGQTLSSWQRQPKISPCPEMDFASLVLMPDRDWLHERINRRFVQMVENGALEEAEAINTLDLDAGSTGSRAVGLQALRDYLDHRLTRTEAIELGQTLSRQYAKRQYTWFNNQPLPHPSVMKETDGNVPPGIMAFLHGESISP